MQGRKRIPAALLLLLALLLVLSLPALIAPAILAAGLFIGFNPEVFPNDAWYYGLATGCLAGMLVNALFVIGRYNDLATRPVPNFFRREGANNARS